jgi:adenylate cyclase
MTNDSHPPCAVRLRLKFDDRELLVDERRSSITIGRADDNDVVLKGHLISRLHARIEISHNKMILLFDQSTNGTFVQTDGGDELFVRNGSLQIKGRGVIGLGRVPERDSPHTLSFTCEEV